MNPGPTADRVYHALKARILGRQLRPGERLDPSVLADALASSATPVRDALHILVGERLVEAWPNGGFHVPQLDEPALQDLYAWSADLLLISIKAWVGSHRERTDRSAGGAIADRTEQLFLQIAGRSANGEHAAAVSSVNARLHPARGVEPHLLDGLDEELAALAAAEQAEDRPKLRQLVAAYHRRRQRAAAEIVRAVYRHD